MNRILPAAAVALALCAPVTANANLLNGVTTQNYNEKFNGSLALMNQMGSKPTTICFSSDSCLTVMDFADPVQNHVSYSLNWYKSGSFSYTYLCVSPLGTDYRECINQFGKHTLEHFDSAGDMWKTTGTLTD